MKQPKAASRRALIAIVAEVNIPMHDKGKRKIINKMEEEQSFKFQEDPLVQKENLATEEKRQQCNKRNVQRKREK